MAIRVNLNPLKATALFPYLGRTVTYNNSDWVALYINLQKSQRIWRIFSKVLGQIGALIKAQQIMYEVLVQAVLLYGSKIWLVTDKMMAVLEVFHYMIARRITVITARKGSAREWE